MTNFLYTPIQLSPFLRTQETAHYPDIDKYEFLPKIINRTNVRLCLQIYHIQEDSGKTMGNSFSSADFINAREAFIRWQGSIDDTVEGYVLRSRKNELRQLVKRVIENELSDYDKAIVNMRWYQNMTPTEIAEKLGVDRSTVARHLDKINNTVYEKLKYAMEYRYGKSFSKQSEMIIKSGDAYTCTVSSDDISERLKKLRTHNCLSEKEVASLTGIEEKRLSEIEEAGSSMTMTELKKLTTFYRCSSDYLLFGKGISNLVN